MKETRVKILTNVYLDDLEMAINDFIDGREVIDIKFIEYGDYFSAMILFSFHVKD